MTAAPTQVAGTFREAEMAEVRGAASRAAWESRMTGICEPVCVVAQILFVFLIAKNWLSHATGENNTSKQPKMLMTSHQFALSVLRQFAFILP